MNSITNKLPIFLSALGLVLFSSLPTVAQKPHQPTVIAVTGQSDWSIVPPAIPSEYVTFHDDGSVTIVAMPLAGNFSVTGDGVSIEGTIRGILNADLDPTLSGPIHGPLTVTTTINGREMIAFQGLFFGRADALLAYGQIILEGRGHFAGTTIAVSFVETDPNSETFVLGGNLFDRRVWD